MGAEQQGFDVASAVRRTDWHGSRADVVRRVHRPRVWRASCTGRYTSPVYFPRGHL
jgi:hypothetical protein